MSGVMLPAEPVPGETGEVAPDTPWDLLQACHDRVNRTLALLERLCSHVVQHGADRDAREAAIDVMRYFDLAAVEHHRDEERHVFPVLLADASGDWTALVERLLAQHRQMERDWQVLRSELVRLVEASFMPSPALFGWRSDMTERVHDFLQLYLVHIALEEEQAYPACQPRMSRPAQTVMLSDMRVRRQQGHSAVLPTASVETAARAHTLPLPITSKRALQ